MWEIERRKTIIRNVIIFLVLLLAVVGLVLAMMSVFKKISEEDALLLEQQSTQRQEQTIAREENLGNIENVYQQHLATVAQYLPGIVCWGDSLTTGSSGNTSYPNTLQKYIETYMLDIYDVRYSIENPETYSRLKKEDYKISVPVVNMGSGQEGSATTLGRSGVLPFVVNMDFVIPAGQESVTITLAAQDGRAVTPLMAGNAGVNPVTIAGVQGNLTRIVDSRTWTVTEYQFTRLEPGMETPVASGTPIITASTNEYKDYIHIVWLGTYGDYIDPETLVKDTKALLARQTANTDRYLVIGPCTLRGTWGSGTSWDMDALDSTMLQVFGNHYINIRKYLIEDGMRDAGLSISTQDAEDIRVGWVPSSLRSSAGGADLTGVAYKLLGKLVYERMELLGYFDEVWEELNLERITEDILKEDPGYFTTRLSQK